MSPTRITQALEGLFEKKIEGFGETFRWITANRNPRSERLFVGSTREMSVIPILTPNVSYNVERDFAPVDVVLDHDRALIVQPDVLFVSTARLSIIRNQVWGAPDLVAEVLSHRTRHRDRGEKLEWYREYGVRECWLVDLHDDSVTVVDFTGPSIVMHLARGIDSIRSTVLPGLALSAFGLFA